MRPERLKELVDRMILVGFSGATGSARKYRRYKWLFDRAIIQMLIEENRR